MDASLGTGSGATGAFRYCPSKPALPSGLLGVDMPEELPDVNSCDAAVTWVLMVDVALDKASLSFVLNAGSVIELFEPSMAARASRPLLLGLSAVNTEEAEMVGGESAYTVTHSWLQLSSFSSFNGAVRLVTTANSARYMGGLHDGLIYVSCVILNW